MPPSTSFRPKMEPVKPQELWEESADAWAAFVEEGDKNRDLLLDPVMLRLCGNVQGARVADIGCGEGRFGRMLAKRGAQVIGLDPTRGLIRLASRKGGTPRYLLARAENIPIASETIDLVVSYVTLVDIEGYRQAIAEMARVLRPHGRLLVANLNPFVTAHMDGWTKGANGEYLHYPVDDYLTERGERVSWRGLDIVNYHRPMSAYFDAFLASGLVLRRFEEPAPTRQAIREAPGLAPNLRVPFFHVAEWQKAP